MKLEFNDLAELDSFLSWAKQYHGQPTTILQVTRPTATAGTSSLGSIVSLGAGGSAGTSSADAPLPEIDKHAFDTPPAAAEAAGDVPEQSAEPAKRKRRTKAEIEAAAASEARPEEAAALAEAVQQDKAAESQTQPEGTNPFEQAAVPAVDPAAPVDDVPNAEPDVVTPFQHLTRGREFIAKHGMPKYLETFTKAGTDPNVMGYSAYQRGLHMAAMDELDKV